MFTIPKLIQYVGLVYC